MGRRIYVMGIQTTGLTQLDEETFRQLHLSTATHDNRIVCCLWGFGSNCSTLSITHIYAEHVFPTLFEPPKTIHISLQRR
jgi:hypothetical protein